MTVHNLIVDQLKISKEIQKSHADRNYTPKQFNVGEKKVEPHPQTYAKGPSLLIRVRWEGYDSSEDYWEPYINVKRTDCFDDYLKTSDKFRLLLLSDEYNKLSISYPSRFPRTLRAIINS